MLIQPVIVRANTIVQKLADIIIMNTDINKMYGTLPTILYIGFIIISNFFEKPHIAPITTRIVMLIRAHTNARDIDIPAPYHTASKVDSPEAPLPSTHLSEEPKRFIASVGVK